MGMKEIHAHENEPATAPRKEHLASWLHTCLVHLAAHVGGQVWDKLTDPVLDELVRSVVPWLG